MMTNIRCIQNCDKQISGFCYNWLARHFFAEEGKTEGPIPCQFKRNDITKKYDDLLDRKRANGN